MVDYSHDEYYPIETGSYISSNHIIAEDDGAGNYYGIQRIAKNHNLLIAEYDPCDLISYNTATSGGYKEYQETGALNSVAVEEIWCAFFEQTCKDFTNIVVEIVCEAPTIDVDVSAYVQSLGGGAGAAQTVTAAASPATLTWTLAQGSADPIEVVIDAISASGTPVLRVYAVRVYYSPLASPLGAGPTAGTAIYPLDSDMVTADEPASTWIQHIASDACVGLCLGRPARWSMVDVFMGAAKAIYFRTNATAYYALVYSFTVDAHSPMVGIYCLAEASDAATCKLKCVSSVNGAVIDEIDYTLGFTAPAYDDWEDAGNLDVDPNNPTRIDVYLKSGASGYSNLIGLIATELWT